MRRYGLAAAALFVFVGGAPARADGLEKFEKLIKPDIPAGTLKYKSGKALGDNGFVLEDVVVTPPPDQTNKAEPVNIKRIAVEDLDFAAAEKKAAPNFARIRAEGIAIAANPAEGVDLKEMAGLDKLLADFQLDYRLDPDRQTFTLNRLELDVNQLARLELTMMLDGVTPEAFADPSASMDKTSLRTASLVLEDRSLLGKVVPAVAKAQGTDPAGLLKTVKPVLQGLASAQGPNTQAALDTVAAFVDDYKQPKGPLRITVNPPSKTSATDLAAAANGDDAIKALGLIVSYAGAPAKASDPAAGGRPAVAAPSAAKPSCAPGSRFFVLYDDAWQAATARKEGKAADTCIAKIEGNGDDDVTVAMDKTVAWSIDGPGKPVSGCRAGDKVVVLHEGDWYPAEVTKKPVAEGQCSIKYESDEEEEKVELKKVRKLD